MPVLNGAVSCVTYGDEFGLSLLRTTKVDPLGCEQYSYFLSSAATMVVCTINPSQFFTWPD